MVLPSDWARIGERQTDWLAEGFSLADWLVRHWGGESYPSRVLPSSAEPAVGWRQVDFAATDSPASSVELCDSLVEWLLLMWPSASPLSLKHTVMMTRMSL